jgi:hypothetical protein
MVEQSGSAYYTQVMEQVAENTAQIAKTLEALDSARYEICKVMWERQVIQLFSTRKCFVAVATGSEGVYDAGKSEPFHDKKYSERGKETVLQTREAVAALNGLVQFLIAEGWEPTEHPNEYWYNRAFRRRVKPRRRVRHISQNAT